MVLAIVIAKQLPDDMPLWQAGAMVAVYLGFYLTCEAAFSATPGKLLTGLRVMSFDGSRCSVKQAVIRTLFRVVEVNPFVLGGLPAAAQILWTRNKQRLGDRCAGTVVVFRRQGIAT
jgi:uncharacterized RDD family membrane protein YckC